MNIAGIELKNNIFLAPMAGVTGMPFRRLCMENGCGLVYTEMISSRAIYYNDQKSFELSYIGSDEKACALQIFGSEPEIMAIAVRKLEESKALFIDINMGCPAPKIVKNGDGAALMKNPALAGSIIEAVVKASNKPVTVKIRKGWDKDNINAAEIAKIAEQNGASAITIHGRTRDQFYSGICDLDIIKRVKETVNIPVIGNGDIKGPGDVLAMLDKTGCDAVMIGREALGYPWIFSQITGYLETGELLKEPTVEERLQMAKRHLLMEVELKGENRGVMEMRKHLSWYVKGIKNSTQLKERLFKLIDVKSINEALDGFIR